MMRTRLAIVVCVAGATVAGCTYDRRLPAPRGHVATPPAAPAPVAPVPSGPPESAAATGGEAALRPWQRDADWQLRKAVLAALKPALRINQWREDCDLTAGVFGRRPAPVDFDMIVFAYAGGREWELLRVTAAAGDLIEEHVMLDAERLDGFLERVREDPRVSVVLRPAPGGASDWSEEVWYPQVVVRWEWY